MVFKNLCIRVLWMKFDLALQGLMCNCLSCMQREKKTFSIRDGVKTEMCLQRASSQSTADCIETKLMFLPLFIKFATSL